MCIRDRRDAFLNWGALLAWGALLTWGALFTSGALLSLGALLGRPVLSLASALSVHHSSTWNSFLWIVKTGVLDGKRKWTLTGENKKEAHTDRQWLQQIFRSYNMDLKLSWAAWSTTTVRQREHLSWICAAGELWHMFLFVLSFVLFFCCCCAEAPQVTKASRTWSRVL